MFYQFAQDEGVFALWRRDAIPGQPHGRQTAHHHHHGDEDPTTASVR